MDLRPERAATLASKKGAIRRVHGKTYEVKSQSGIGAYRVDLDQSKCTCPDFIKRGQPCKHLLATRYYLHIERAGTTTTIPLTRGQAWAAYNAAQTAEARLFDVLLRDLCNSVPEPVQLTGRPRYPLKDALFCAVKKVHSHLSSRRAHGLFHDAVEEHHLDRAPHFNMTTSILRQPWLTPIMHGLITESARPLAGIETAFAVDSSGFRTTKFYAYNDSKHGQRRAHDWLKAHVMVGTRTHVVTRASITDGNGADSPQFPGLVAGTAGAGFNVLEVSADKAYSSRENHEAAASVGGVAFIPFKVNASGLSRGSPMWRKAYHYFQLHRDEFDAKYHRRSNVESAFGAIKAKFGDSVKARTRVGQENELLCKMLAYNLTVLIHEMHEHGISPDFLTAPCHP